MNKKFAFIPLSLIVLLSGCLSKPEERELTPQELIKSGQIDKAKGKFQLTSDINEIDEDGNTVLHLASMINDEDLVTYFLIKGADQNLKNNDGLTPLHVAIEHNSFDAARVLANYGKNIFTKDSWGDSAVTKALKKNDAFYDIFITAETGELRDENGKSIVHYFVESKDLKAVRMAIKKGLPISYQDKNGKTPLDYAFNYVNDYTCVEIAAELIIGGAEEIETDFSYFQNALSSRNI